MRNLLVQVFTRSYQDTVMIYWGKDMSDDEVTELIFNTNMYFINGERPTSYMILN